LLRLHHYRLGDVNRLNFVEALVWVAVLSAVGIFAAARTTTITLWRWPRPSRSKTNVASAETQRFDVIDDDFRVVA